MHPPSNLQGKRAIINTKQPHTKAVSSKALYRNRHHTMISNTPIELKCNALFRMECKPKVVKFIDKYLPK
jgi:hypothetical protein